MIDVTRSLGHGAFDGAELFIVQDTKNPSMLPLTFTADEWDAFIKRVKAGEFDRPDPMADLQAAHDARKAGA